MRGDGETSKRVPLRVRREGFIRKQSETPTIRKDGGEIIRPIAIPEFPQCDIEARFRRKQRLRLMRIGERQAIVDHRGLEDASPNKCHD